MTVTDQFKIIDNKIKANQAQFNVDRLAAKISALSSGKFEKYEYFTGENLGYEPNVVEQVKFDYSPLGKIFNKGLDKDDKNVGLLKRLKNIENKSEKQLEDIENQRERKFYTIKKQGKKQSDAFNKQKVQLKEIEQWIKKVQKSEKIVLLRDRLDEILISYDMIFSTKGENILKKVAEDERLINYNNLFFKTGDPIINNYDFLKKFDTLNDLLLKLLNKEVITIKTANEQNELLDKIYDLKNFILLEEKQGTKKQRQKHKQKIFCRIKIVL